MGRAATIRVSRAVLLHLQTLGAEAGLVQQGFQKALDGRVAGGVVANKQIERTVKRGREGGMTTG